jgi:hypothetical protein
MHNLKKLTALIPKLLFALILALALLNVTSCDDMLGGDSPTFPTQPTNPDDNNPTNPNGDKTHYSDYENFNPADYPILNESGKSDSEIAWLRDIIWLMYAEKEDVGDWATNYIKSNKIKTILSDGIGGWAWVRPNQLDRFYLSTDGYYRLLSFYNESGDDDKASQRRDVFRFFTHETMHLVQYKSNVFNLMKGMRPNICAATDLLTEYLAWFYTERRSPGTIITADMKDAVERQSEYMISSTDPWNDPNEVIHTPWFNNELSGYMQHAFTVSFVRENAMTPPLRQASKEDMLKVARAMLACRDPKMAGVTDEALWTVFDALCKAAVGDSKYLRFNPDGENYGLANRDSFNDFQAFIAEWDAAFAAQ